MACINCGCPECLPNGCPIQLDFSCVLYHKDNNEPTELDGLGLTNGATLELVIETLDEKVKQLNATGFNLPCLRATYTINSFSQFANAVDTELCALKGDVAGALGASSQALVANDSSTIDFSLSGALNHTLSAAVKVSASAGNRLSVQADGLHAAAQTLSVNYATKEITISDGNTVSLSSLVCGPSGFLGNVAADPAAVDGQYWFNTTSSTLKIKVNGVVKTIQTA